MFPDFFKAGIHKDALVKNSLENQIQHVEEEFKKTNMEMNTQANSLIIETQVVNVYGGK